MTQRFEEPGTAAGAGSARVFPGRRPGWTSAAGAAPPAKIARIVAPAAQIDSVSHRSYSGGVMAERRILLVDDDVTLRELLADALEREGFAVLRAGNGEEGVAAALAGKPDLVISDIVMPRMNGWELCETLRTIPSTKAIPFLFLSTLEQTPDKLLAARLGADDYLTKPFHLDAILTKVQQLVGRVDQREKVLAGAEEAATGAGLESMLIDTIEFLRTTKRTGVISVKSGPSRGLIYIENGILKHAVLGKKRGETALLALLRLPESQVVFKEGSFPNLPANVKVPWGEFMVSLLERGAEGSLST
jgi:CheY-like chemotaxis protein